MNTQFLVLAAFVGWCGTPWPRRWPWPWPPPPPDPNPWISKIIGVIGGIAGGWALGSMGGAEGIVAVAIGAWAGSVFFNDLYGLATGGLKR
jgi:predicted lipid-binding transport protein (Tim44 family)